MKKKEIKLSRSEYIKIHTNRKTKTTKVLQELSCIQ